MFQKLFTCEIGFLDALFGQFSDHFGLGSYRRMVGAGHPKGVFAFHARAAHEYVLNSVVEHVAHVEHSGHIWRRDHDCVRFARVWHGAEKLMVSPKLILPVFYFGRSILRGQFVHI